MTDVLILTRFGGDPGPGSVDPNAPLEENPTVIEKVKLKIAETAKSFQIDMWLARQTPEKVLPILQKFIEGAKEEFADAVANGGGIYAVGYCFGGKYVLLLGGDLPDTIEQSKKGTDEEQGTVKAQPLIKAGALAHGTTARIGRLFQANINRDLDHQARPRGCQSSHLNGMCWYV